MATKSLMMRLMQERVREAEKHNLSPYPWNWAVDQINELSNSELLGEISDALDDMLEEVRNGQAEA